MIDLPSPDKMAQLVSNVTQTMLGITFEPAQTVAASQLTWRTVMLPIPGAHPLLIGLSSDEPGCVRLSSAMFQCPQDSVDAAMMNDSLCELLNMTAGLLKGTLSLDQALGLPRVVPENDVNIATAKALSQATVLRAKDVGLVLWILQGATA